MMDWTTGSGTWWGMSMMVLFWVGLIATLLLVVRAIDRGHDRYGLGAHPELDARQILDARFARGEISREEYEERSAVLSNRP